MNEISEVYFCWIQDLISSSKPIGDYGDLLLYLFCTEFYWSADQPRDENRYHDGMNLRYRFAYDSHISIREVDRELGEGTTCSLLEMMVALALRCEEDIMANGRYDRTSVWFWEMIENLGLTGMTDDYFDARYTQKVIDRFLNRQYEYDGKGGLVHLDDPPRDIRDVEIWSQMMLYLNEQIKKGLV